MATFNKIFVEEEVARLPRTKNILNFLGKEPILIKKIDNVFGRVRKPYLEKRTNLNLLIGKKRGTLVKLAPDAYGQTFSHSKEALHYYFIHAYNCLYECEYCYLQGYFSSPDLVFFVNHEEIIAAMEKKVSEHPDKKLFFHGGEFSDSLVFSHITNELPLYWSFFKKHPQATLELRSKSNNIQALLVLPPLPNAVISFTLSPEVIIKKYEHKTPSLKARLSAISELSAKGFTLGIHLDPIFYHPEVASRYESLIKDLSKALAERKTQLAYLSLGVVRFPKDIFQQVQENYSTSDWLQEDFKTSFDGKLRYPRPQRKFLLKQLQQKLMDKGFCKKSIYFCMEQQELED